MNTREVIRNVQLLGGGIALLSVAGLAVAITKGLNNRKVYKRPFDPDTVTEIKGKIMDIDHSKEKKDEIRGIYLYLQTEKGILPVHLGPVWYLDRQQKRFKAGDKITVKGSRVQFKGKEAVVAQIISKGNELLNLRNEDGTPSWQAWSKS